jgi:hypothetical protein
LAVVTLLARYAGRNGPSLVQLQLSSSRLAVSVGFAVALIATPTVVFAQEAVLPATSIASTVALYAETTPIGIDTRLLRSPGTERGGRRSVIVPLYAMFAGLQALDAHSTMRALNAGAVESNPLMQWAATRPAALIAVKSGAAAGTIFLAEKGWKQHPVRTVVLMAVLNAAYAGVAMHNYRVANLNR